MNDYPEVVAKIANDYLERVKSQLRLVPAREQEEFLRELQSHLYEAYRQMPGGDEVARILAVLRNLGEPAEVVSDRLPEAMLRSGASRNLPLYLAGGILIALFGIPLGFSGVGVVLGLLGALAGVVAAYYAVAGSVLLVGAIFALVGVARILLPHLWDRMEALGLIQVGGQVGYYLDRLPVSEQGLFWILLAALFIACGLGMLRLGAYLLAGLRLLLRLAFDWTRRLAQRIRRHVRRGGGGRPAWNPLFTH